MGLRMLNEYTIIGSATPTETNMSPQTYKMITYAKNEVIARSHFMALMKRKHKIKNALVLKIDISVEHKEKVDIYGINFTLKTKYRTLNMYKEVRQISRADAVNELYDEVCGRHTSKRQLIKIIDVRTVAPEDAKREKSVNFEKGTVVFGKRVTRVRDFVASE